MKTNVHFILDRSGSMASCMKQTISGFNEYIGTLKKDTTNTKYSMTLTLFDDVVDIPYRKIDISEVKELTEETFQPRGMTALYDAVCSTIKKINKGCDCNKCEECGEPLKEKHIVVIMTDGEENSSREYTQKHLNDMVKELSKENFTFVFLGANQDSYQTAASFGISAMNTSNYSQSEAGTRSVFMNMATATMSLSGSGEGNTTSFFNADQKKDIESHA